MTDYTTPLLLPSRTMRRHARRGQAAVVALLVLLLLGFVGALFITIVARNVFNARHANRVVSADYYAKAGITFADAQMTYGPDGADWRPPLQVQLATAPVNFEPSEAREANRYLAIKPTLPAVTATDPDKVYLEQGFARYTAGSGRFLLRLTYDPVNLNDAPVPPGRYIKIEAIGREGVIDPLDPTTYANNRSSDRTQAYQVAYKPIGITDYARFETNLENRSDIANIGVVSEMYAADPDGHIATPGATDFNGTVTAGVTNYQLYPVITTYGAVDAYLKDASGALYPNPSAGTSQSAPAGYTFAPGGGSNRANMPVRFFGKNVFYLNDALATAPLFEDTCEIAGNLLLDNYQSADPLDNSGTPAVGQRASLVLNPPASGTTPLTNYITPSNGPSFDTRNGLIRDGSSQNDANGIPRAIKRLEPPLMDGLDPGSSLPRYKEIALTSPPRLDPSTNLAYTGSQIAANGYGRSIYINNTDDIQPESKAIGGGTTLTDEWLNTTKAAKPGTAGGWNGDLYDPVGVNITLGMQTASIKGALSTFAGIRLTRSDTTTKSAFDWRDPSGNAITTANPTGTALDGTSASTMYVAYASLNASNDPASVASSDNLNNDVLIYAEGNVRVHGIVSPNENLSGVGASNFIPRHITIVTNGTAYIDGSILKGSPDSSVTVLAHDYVCVNTTQFLAGTQDEAYPAQKQTGVTVGTKTFNAFTFSDVTDKLVQDLSFGLPDPNKTVGTVAGVGGTYASQYLYVSGASESGAANSAQVNFSIFNAAGAPMPIGGIIGNFGDPSREVFDISASGTATLMQTDVGQLQVSLDATNTNASTSGKFLLERAAVLPSDIRIEAVLYAQTRSFFVIPGPSFNSDPSDTLDTFAALGARDSLTASRFPFYGQPIDMKIVIDGAIAESRPADINAQTAWMLRWGWIPQYHGSLITGATSEMAGHPNRVGLQIIYNPQAGYPYNPVNSYYLRSDQYGRPLPFSPRLPVSTALLYAGESGEAPILQ